MNKQIKIGMFLQYTQIFANIIIKLFFTALVLRYLGQVEYGIYSLVSSIVSYLSLLSLGFGSSYVHFYTKYKVKNDEESIKKLNGLYLIVYSIMGLTAFIIGTVLTLKFEIFFNDTYTADNLQTAQILMALLTITMTFSFPMSVFNSYITSQEKFIFQKTVNLIQTLLSPIVCLIALFCGYGSIGLVVASMIVTALVDLSNFIFCFKKLKMRFLFKGFEKGLFKALFVFSLFIAINEIVNQINTQTDKLILGKTLTIEAVSIYAVSSTIYSLYMTLSTSISNFFVPRVHQIVEQNTENTNDQLTTLFINIGKAQFSVLMLIFTGFIFFGKYFINIWAGEGYQESYLLAIILISGISIPLIQNIGIEIQRAKNLHKFRSIVYLIIAILNLIISIILCKYLGIIGVAVGTLVSYVIGNGLIMNVYYHKKIGLNILKFWKEILRMSLGLIIPISCGIFIMLKLEFSNILVYLVSILAYSIIYIVSMFFVGLKNNEKVYISNGIKKFFKKRNEDKK